MPTFIKIFSFRISTKGFDDAMKNLEAQEKMINDLMKNLYEQGARIIDVKIDQGVYIIMYEADRPLVTKT